MSTVFVAAFVALFTVSSALAESVLRLRVDVISIPYEKSVQMDQGSWAEVQAMLKTGEAIHEDFLLTTVPSESNSATESIQEFIYETEVEAGGLGSAPRPVVSYIPGTFVPLRAVWPAAFETRNLGESLVVEAGPLRGHRIEVRIDLEWTKFDRWTMMSPSLVPGSKAEVKMPLIKSERFARELSLVLDEPTLLGSYEPRALDGQPRRLHLIFVKINRLSILRRVLTP